MWRSRPDRSRRSAPRGSSRPRRCCPRQRDRPVDGYAGAGREDYGYGVPGGLDGGLEVAPRRGFEGAASTVAPRAAASRGRLRGRRLRGRLRAAAASRRGGFEGGGYAAVTTGVRPVHRATPATVPSVTAPRSTTPTSGRTPTSPSSAASQREYGRLRGTVRRTAGQRTKRPAVYGAPAGRPRTPGGLRTPTDDRVRPADRLSGRPRRDAVGRERRRSRTARTARPATAPGGLRSARRSTANPRRSTDARRSTDRPATRRPAGLRTPARRIRALARRSGSAGSRRPAGDERYVGGDSGPEPTRPERPRPLVARRWAYLSMSPTTKNIEPRIAIRSGTRQPGISVASACTLAYEAVRSFSRHGVFSPRDTR